MRALPHLEIRELRGYSRADLGGRMPNWKTRPRYLYSPITSQIFEADWETFCLLKNISCGRDYKRTDIGHEHRIGELKKNYFLSDKQTSEFSIRESNTTLELYLELTQLCNFKCPGCAVGLDSIASNMRFDMDIVKTKEMLNGAFKLAKEKNFNKVKIKYAGGEPLLKNAQKLIVQIHEIVQVLSQTHHLELDEVIITNGSLLERSIDFIKKLNLRVNVSFWGYGAGNDRERKTCGMTFDGIIGGLVKVIENTIPLSVTYVITPTNADQIESLIHMLYDKKNPNWIGHKVKLSGPIPIHIAFFRPQNILQYHIFQKQEGHVKIVDGVRNAIDAFRKILKNKMRLPYLGNAFDYLDIDNTFVSTCGSGTSYIALGSCGANLCHEALRDEENFHEAKDLEKLVSARYLGNKPPTEDLSKLNATELTLMLHGGRGCPRIKKIEKRLKNNPSYARSVYLPIIEEVIAIEVARRAIQDDLFRAAT